MIVLDASVLIAHAEPADPHHDAARVVIEDALDDGLAVSPITLAEFYVGPARADALDRAERVVRSLELTVVALGPDAPRRLAQLRASSGLRLPDCCVLLAAEDAMASIASFDQRLLGRAAELGIATADATA